MDLKNKVILISGASSGMGREIVRILSNEECKLALFSRREKKLEEISKELKENNIESVYKKCDVKNKLEIKNAIDLTYETYGKIDVAILAAGILIPNPLQNFDSNIIKDSIEVNFLGNVYFIEYLLNKMKSQKSGTIAVTSTLPDKRGVPGWGAYGASKAALSWFLESLRAEAKQEYNINIITIKPGSVETPMIGEYHRKGAISAYKAADIIIKGIKKEKKIIQFPFFQVLMIRTMDKFPNFVYDNLDIDLQKGDGYPKIKE
ncbi:MAG: SDR family oxidoreductase [Candidatus Thermoplasmatota archaeon]